MTRDMKRNVVLNASGPHRMTFAATLCAAAIFAFIIPFGALAQSSDPLPLDPLPEDEDPGDVEIVVVDIDADNLADTVVTITQDSIGNTVETAFADRRDISFVDGGNYNQGIFAVNQDAGNLNQQANVVAVAGAVSGEASDGLLLSSGAIVRQSIRDNTVIDGGGPESVLIADSFNGSKGIVQINQSVGAINQQVNVIALALGTAIADTPAIALSDQALGGVGGADDNTVIEPDEYASRTSGMINSLDGFEGVFQGNQTVGNLNRVTNSLSVGVLGAGP